MTPARGRTFLFKGSVKRNYSPPPVPKPTACMTIKYNLN